MAVGFPLLQAMISCLQNYYDKQNDSKHSINNTQNISYVFKQNKR